MNNLPNDIIRNIYEYESTYRDQFDETLRQLRCFCFVYRCSECFKPYNKCFCYCNDCRTYSQKPCLDESNFFRKHF